MNDIYSVAVFPLVGGLTLKRRERRAPLQIENLRYGTMP
jgi:hypothetical protein